MSTTDIEPRYPDCVVELSGTDSNAFAVMGKVTRELRRHLVPRSDLSSREILDIIDDFRREATAGDYDHLLRTCMAWVTVQ